MTVEQLLNHTSGIPQDIVFDDPSPGAEVIAMLVGHQEKVTAEIVVFLKANAKPRPPAPAMVLTP